MPVPSDSWFPVLTLILGFGASSLAELLRDRRLLNRERESREALRRGQAIERSTNFQRQTLLDLQDALFQLARAAGASYHQDLMAYRQTGQWQKQLLPDGSAEAVRLAQARTSILHVRVADVGVRELVCRFKAEVVAVLMSPGLAESEYSHASMGTTFEEINQRIGEILRSLDESPV
jgi:hypothetical protein